MLGHPPHVDTSVSLYGKQLCDRTKTQRALARAGPEDVPSHESLPPQRAGRITTLFNTLRMRRMTRSYRPPQHPGPLLFHELGSHSQNAGLPSSASAQVRRTLFT